MRHHVATTDAIHVHGHSGPASDPDCLMCRPACWSCGVAATRPDGLCADCGLIDGSAVPDLNDPTWRGNTKPLEAIFVAPPNARTVR